MRRLESRDSSVSIVTSLQDGELKVRGSIAGRDKRFVSSRNLPGSVPPSILCSGYLEILGLFFGG